MVTGRMILSDISCLFQSLKSLKTTPGTLLPIENQELIYGNWEDDIIWYILSVSESQDPKDNTWYSIFPIENQELIYGNWEDDIIWYILSVSEPQESKENTWYSIFPIENQELNYGNCEDDIIWYILSASESQKPKDNTWYSIFLLRTRNLSMVTGRRILSDISRLFQSLKNLKTTPGTLYFLVCFSQKPKDNTWYSIFLLRKPGTYLW